MGAPTLVGFDIEYVVWRIIQTAVNEADPMYYERIATMYESWPCERNNLIALNCRRHAKLLREAYAERGIEISPEVHDVLSEDT